MSDKMREALGRILDEVCNHYQSDAPLFNIANIATEALREPCYGTKLLIAEAKAIADAHPSKDARAFARSVLDYFNVK